MNLQYKSSSEAVFQIHDVFGKLVYEQPLESAVKMKTVQISADHVPAGAYSYRIVMENEVKSGTIVIVK